MSDKDDGGFASPPCFMHELDASGAWSPDREDPQQAADVARWRKSERKRLLDLRLTMDVDQRRRASERIAAGLDETLGGVEGRIVSCYWPIRGEPDLRGWMERLAGRGAVCALPIVVSYGAPLVFRAWAPGAKLVRGVWNIPVPADGPEIEPDVLIAPLVGFDPERYRLGYGGGFFDRTLAALGGPRFVVGVGYAQAAIPTIYPQSHDIPMDAVVSEDVVVRS